MARLEADARRYVRRHLRRAGCSCGPGTSTRIGFLLYNAAEEVERTLDALADIGD